MKSTHKIFLLPVLLLAFNTTFCQNANKLTLFASGLTSPVCIVNAGDSRLFVADQRGYIRIVSSSGIISSQPFLDLTNRVAYGGERGLLGIAFHPNYKANGYFYVNYIGNGDSTHISRFKVSTGDANVADPQSEVKLMTIFQPYQNHNGGDLNFGPDGFLYIGLGDGGSGGDPGNRAQNPKEFLGKMLRIDVDHGNPYAIPATNPFYNSNTTKGEIWALGLRNPWRFSFDRLTGDLWIADVGQNVFEEIDFQSVDSKGGENYGWRCYEGNQIYNSSGCSSADLMTFPIYTYPHGAECSLTGGYVYRGSALSPFYGYYFFADYCSDKIWTLHKVSGNWVKEDFGQFTGNSFSTFGEDVSGQLNIAGVGSGKILKINDLTTGFIQNEKQTGIKIIQTSFSDKIRVEISPDNQSKMQIEVFDMSATKHYEVITPDTGYDLNLGFLPAGIYLVKVTSGGKSQVQKFVLGK
jgi:glucose/arabinose dehydrogenase